MDSSNTVQAAVDDIVSFVEGNKFSPMLVLLVMKTCRHCHTTMNALTSLFAEHGRPLFKCVCIENGIRDLVIEKLRELAQKKPAQIKKQLTGLAKEIRKTDGFPKIIRHMHGQELSVQEGAMGAGELCAFASGRSLSLCGQA